MNVARIMTKDVVTVTPECTLKEVARLLAEHRIAGLPVCREDGELVGVVSEGDILWKETGLAADHGNLIARILNAADREDDKLDAATAGEAMSAPAVTIGPEAAVAEAARLMIEERVNRLPVVVDGKVVGIVARSDLVRAFLRPDAEIEREITDDVLLRVLWIDPATLAITVNRGAVVLEGVVDNRSSAELVEAYVRRVPGVVSVESRLDWELDDLGRRAARGADQLQHRL